MLGIAFIVSSYILSKELTRRKMDANLATEITLIAIICGIAGAKIFYLFENWDSFTAHPIDMIFNAGGLTFYGGLLFTILAIYIYLKRKKIPFLVIADITAPSLAIAYGIGRIGCHLAGDGDYGIPTSLPWGTDYSRGTVPPSVMFMNSPVAKSFPNGIVPDNTPLHPTPIYEFLVALIIFYVLMRMRKNNWIDGKLFMYYLIMSGIARFLVEFIRLNPSFILGFSEAQVISVLLIVFAVYKLWYFEKNPQLIENKYTPPAIAPKQPPAEKKKK
jgi:phosphatidylglycerol:prolipoprotein diacylglycerol transferase